MNEAASPYKAVLMLWHTSAYGETLLRYAELAKLTWSIDIDDLKYFGSWFFYFFIPFIIIALLIISRSLPVLVVT